MSDALGRNFVDDPRLFHDEGIRCSQCGESLADVGLDEVAYCYSCYEEAAELGIAQYESQRDEGTA